MKTYNIAPLKNLLKDAKSAFIAIAELNLDSVSSALALALSLKEKGLNVSVYSPAKTDANYSKLSGLDLLSDTFNANDLTISLNYPQEFIETVSYNEDGGRLNLVVKVKPNSTKIERDQIIINNQSSVADINFMFGDESKLGKDASIVDRGNWVLVSPTPVQKPWAQASIIDPDAPFSEMLSFLIPMLELPFKFDSAKDLLIGLRVATQSFSVNVSPETFEAGAVCLRATQTNPVVTPTGVPTPNSFDNQLPVENVEKSGNLFGTAQPSSVGLV